MEEKLEQNTNKLIKIALVGPESTGKTTLASALATHFNTTWVREYLRDFSEEKLLSENKSIQQSDNLKIVEEQLKLEALAQKYAHRFLFCDTNFIQTKIYSELYFGKSDAFFDYYVKILKYDLYILTQIDVAWEEDILRDAPYERERHYNYFKKRLIDAELPFIEISGNIKERMEKAIQLSNDLELAKQKGFTPQDIVEFENRGTTLSAVLRQIAVFEQGIPFVQLEKPAILNDGIIKLSVAEMQSKAILFDVNKERFDIQKMVPASGAASRMFEFLNSFLRDFDPETQTINAYINHHRAHQLSAFFAGLEKFPFYKKVKRILKEDFPEYKSWSKEKYYHTFVSLLLSEHYLNYCRLPKGVLPFHKHKTPVQEHLREALEYATSKGRTKVHFTISEEHRATFEQVIAEATQEINGYNFEIDFSYQKKSTDTIAVHFDKTPFRNEQNGEILFRQAGHGALLENLNDLDADIVFIKNIDNVSDVYYDEIVFYKKALGGLLIQLQDQIFAYLHELDQNPSQERVLMISTFAKKQLNIILPEDFAKLELVVQIDILQTKLNRPLRVSGMVKNEGEPGGGPFWIRNDRGELSLQIVESSQINKTDEQQKQILESATHFNPVDLVCGIKNYKGQRFDLIQYRDDNTGFLTEKTKDGYPILGYELPGLWNGAMADWISVFVEVSIKTFSPVKTVNDLIKHAHQ